MVLVQPLQFVAELREGQKSLPDGRRAIAGVIELGNLTGIWRRDPEQRLIV